MIEELFDKSDRKLEKLSNEMTRIDQRLASLEQDSRQPRVAMEADVKIDKKTREHTEGAAKATQAMHGDSVSANRVDPDPMCSTIVGVKAEPSTLPCKDDVLVDNVATAPNSYFSPLKMHLPTAIGGLLPAGVATKATRSTFDDLPLRFCLIAEISSRISTLYVSYFSSFGWIHNQQFPFWSRVIETKSGQNLAYDPGGSTGRLRVCPVFS